jgi:hypothetical protein
VYADHSGFFAALCAGLVACTLLAGCDKEPRHQAGVQEPSLAQQEVSPGTVAERDPGPEADTADDESRLLGDWKGESLVADKNSAAKDEVVVWHITRANEPGKVSIKADKIVNGKAITMGTSVWTYDKAQKTIVWENRVGVWKLTVKGDTMEGTLTLHSGQVFRRVSLRKSE